MKGSINKIESLGLVDGPGIRTVVFFNGCKLRCKFCHNPEMWQSKELNYTVDELVNKILKNKEYFERNSGGVTFSGGEPLLQPDFLLEVCKKLKENNIHIALDTAGVGTGNYDEILKYVDLVLLDIKHVNKDGYKEITGINSDEEEKFIEALNKSKKTVWIRQVIIPGVNNNDEYLFYLRKKLSKIKNIKRIDFLPYHTMAKDKYYKLNIENPYENKEAMDKNICKQLEKEFNTNL